MFEAEYCNGSDYFIGLTFSVFTPTPNWLAILNHVWTLGFGVCPSFFKANSWRKTLRSDIDCYVSCSSPGLISQVTTQEFAEKLEKEVSKPSATQRNLFDKTGMFWRPYFWRCLSRAAGEVVFFFWERLILYDPVQKMQLSRDWTRSNWISDLQFSEIAYFYAAGFFSTSGQK